MRKFIAYLKDVYNEMIHKVTWPSFDELQMQALVVLVATVILAIVILVIDVSFKGLMNLIYSLF